MRKVSTAGEAIHEHALRIDVIDLAYLGEHVEQDVIEADVAVMEPLVVVQLARLANTAREEGRQNDALVILGEVAKSVTETLRPALRPVDDHSERIHPSVVVPIVAWHV